MKELADKLCLSAKTVEAHREHTEEKLNLRTEAAPLRRPERPQKQRE